MSPECCFMVVQLGGPVRSVLSCLPLLSVPPSIENEDVEEAIEVLEGDPTHLACNASGKQYCGVHLEGGLWSFGVLATLVPVLLLQGLWDSEPHL